MHSFIFRPEYLTVANELPPELKGDFLIAIAEYGAGGVVPNFGNQFLRLAWRGVESSLKKSRNLDKPKKIENNFGSLDCFSDAGFGIKIKQIMNDYQVPESFVRSKMEDITNWCGANGKRYKNYYLALRDWTKRDAIKIRREGHGTHSKLYIGEI